MREPPSLSRIAGLCTLGLATSWSTTAAFAVCGTPTVGGGGSGPPSISVTEASTTQVLEQIRKRTDAAQEQPITVADATVVAPAPAGSSQSAAAASSASTAAATQAAGGTSGGGQAAAASKPKPSAKPATTAQQAPTAKIYSSGGSAQEAATETLSYGGGYVTTKAAWARGFFDYERHEDLAPNNQENPTRRSYTGGGVSGADWTVAKQSSVPEAMQFGFFSGYSHTKSKFSDTVFSTDETTVANGNDNGNPFLDTDYARSGNEQELDGPFVGAYFAHVAGPWVTDVALKADFFDLSQRSTITQTCGSIDANGNLFDVGTQTGSADVTTYTVAANAAYRVDLTDRAWISPTVGMRYTHTDFSSQTSTAVFTDALDPGSVGTVQPGTLGLDDGYAIRLQGGFRYGIQWISPEGYLWTTVLGAFLYSDVVVEGFNGVAGQTGEIVGPVDEGEVRGLGQMASQVEIGNGMSYQFLAQFYGGDDVFGVGGQIGFRYEW